MLDVKSTWLESCAHLHPKREEKINQLLYTIEREKLMNFTELSNYFT